VTQTICPACGTDLSVGPAPSVCPACGRPVADYSHPYSGVVDAVEYDFDQEPANQRVEATDLLVRAEIPYRWDSGFRLKISPANEAEVDQLFGYAEDAEGNVTDTEPSEDDEPAEWVADEEAVRSLADLFNAADRLRHHPEDPRAITQLADALGAVTLADVPFGINRVLWETAGQLGRQLFGLLNEGADQDDIAAGADALRAVLRDHV